MADQTGETGIFGDKPIALIPADSGDLYVADQQAMAFYDAYPGLTPDWAQDRLLWSWMTHFVWHRYSLGRWKAPTGNKTSWVLTHWFAESLPIIRKYNTASRTWWIAHIATTASSNSNGAFTKQESLDHFSTHPRHYHNLMDSDLSKHPVVMAELVRALMNEAQGISGVGSDQLWKRMNLASGIVLFDAMPRETIREHIAKSSTT